MPFVLQMGAVFNNNLPLWIVKHVFLDTFAMSVSLWDLVVNVQISIYKKWRLISLDRQNVVLLVLILTQKKPYYLHFFSFANNCICKNVCHFLFYKSSQSNRNFHAAL
jgi:hypothetical protein